MPLDRFLDELLRDGRLGMQTAEPLTVEALAAAEPRLGPIAQRAALDLPGPPPDFVTQVASWALGVLYHACQALVFRELPAAEVRTRLAPPAPLGPSAASAWSADLFLRHLPALHAPSRALGSADPLVRSLGALAQAWPLSSAGIPLEAPPPSTALDPVLAHPTLRRLYADRVLLAGDRARLADPQVLDAARAALGAHTELCPELVELLEDSA